MARPLTWVTRVCPQCNLPFTKTLTEMNKQRHCSPRCGQLARDPATRATTGNRTPRVKTRVTVTCAKCGTAFERIPSLAAQYTRHYCSNPCRTTDKPTGRYKTLPHRQCQVCGTKFYAKPYTVRLTGAKFCSPQCMGIAKRAKVSRACRWCGASFETAPSHDAIYCNRGCRFDHMRVDPTLSGTYKGGRVPYYGANWTKQRRLARQRDGNTCQRCGLHRERPALHVHHLRPLRDFAGDWSTANALANLITLCRPCHRRVECGAPLTLPA